MTRTTSSGLIVRLRQYTVARLLSIGFLVSRTVDRQSLLSLVARLRPVRTKFPLIRVGAEFDGGYLVPDDLAGLGACYSPGVDRMAEFERHLLTLGVGSHLADYSVDGPPNGFLATSFTKKFIGGFEKAHYMTLDHWVRMREAAESHDLILQMDIEGAEYVSLLTVSSEVLTRFRIIVLEVHWTNRWSLPGYFEVVETMFDKLLELFNVVHIHPNNCADLINVNGVLCPAVFELTLLRKDRSPALGWVNEFPHPLDHPNSPDRAEIVLPKAWRGEGNFP